MHTSKPQPPRIGYFISPQGGAPNPREIPPDEFLFEVLTRGQVYSPDPDHAAPCDPGWIFAHPPGAHTIHKTPPDFHYECLTISWPFMHLPDSEPWPRAFYWQDPTEAVRFAHEMLFAYHHTRVARPLLGNLIWSQFRFRLDQHLRQQQRKDIPPRIAAVMAYMDKNFAAQVTIAHLADIVELSPSHLQARFREFVKRSPHQYLIQQRMRAACHRLVRTNDPVKQIAQEVGYPNPEHFCRAFKKETNHTPANFRRRYRVYPESQT